MQKLLLTLTLLICSFASDAQRYTDLKLFTTKPVHGDSADLDSTLVNIHAYVVNIGPDTVKAGDTLRLTAYTPIMPFPAFTVTTFNIKPGDTIEQVRNVGFLRYPYDSVNLCLNISISNTNDPIMDTVAANNDVCATIYHRDDPTGIIEQFKNNASAKLYPNPMSNNVYLSTNVSAAQTGELQLTDLLGRVVMTQKLNLNGAQHIMLNVEELPLGMYVYKISSSDIMLTGRIEKQ